MRIISYITSLSLTATILSACSLWVSSNSVEPTIDISSLSITPDITPVISSTPDPILPTVLHETQIPKPTYIGNTLQEAESTIKASATYVDATPISVPLPTTYNLPTWLSRPDTAILLTITYDVQENKNYFTFVDVIHNERFDLLTPPYTWEANWGHDVNGWYFDYIRREVKGSNILDAYHERAYLSDGQIHRTPITAGTPRVVSEASNGDYTARVSQEKSNIIISLEDESNGQSILLADPFDGHYPDYATIAWSSLRDFLAVTRYKWAGEPFRPPSSGLTIYTVDGRIYGWYAGLDVIDWSPNNNERLLYVKGTQYGIQNACILEIVLTSNICLESVINWRMNRTSDTGNYRWLPNGEQISFTYWSSRNGGVCVADINTDKVSCPINQKTLGPDKFVIDYDWSPDGEYIWLIVDSAGPLSDDRSFAQVATADKNGGSLQIWGRGSISSNWQPKDFP